MGDVILSTPVLTAIKTAYPEARITMLVRRYTHDIIDGHPDIDNILCLEDIEALPFLKQITHIRHYNFDHVIILHPRYHSSLIAACSRIPVRISSGYRWYSFLFNRRIYEHRKTAEHHEVDYNLRMLKVLDIPFPKKVEFKFHIPKQAINDVELLLQQAGVHTHERLIIIHPGSGGSARDWPLLKLTKLADRLANLDNTRIILTGGKNETELAQQLLKKTESQPINMVGTLTIKQLAALIKRSQLFIANSTGPLHLAVAVGTEVVSFYCPIIPCLPTRWGPYKRVEDSVLMPPVAKRCDKCTLKKCRHYDCMALISVDHAFEMAIKKLNFPE